MPECLPDLPRYVRQRVDGQWEGADHPDGPWRIASPDGIQWTPWLTDGPAVPESREPASVAPEATGQAQPLSPAAQAVLQATHRAMAEQQFALSGVPDYRQVAAAALQAVADQVVPEPPMIVPGGRSYEGAWSATVQDAIRRQILAIAAELEKFND